MFPQQLAFVKLGVQQGLLIGPVVKSVLQHDSHVYCSSQHHVFREATLPGAHTCTPSFDVDSESETVSSSTLRKPLPSGNENSTKIGISVEVDVDPEGQFSDMISTSEIADRVSERIDCARSL